MSEYFYNEFVLGLFGFAQFTAGQIQVFKQVAEVFFTFAAHGALLNIGQHFLQVFENKFVHTARIAAFGKLAKKFGGL